MAREQIPSAPSGGGRSGGGKRLNTNQNRPAAKKKKAPRSSAPIGAIAVLAVLALLFAGYAGLCAWVGATIPEGTTVELQPGGQTVSLGGLSVDQAKELLAQSVQIDPNLSLIVSCGSQNAALNAGLLTIDSDAMLQTLAQAEDLVISSPFLTRGVRFLMGGGEPSGPIHFQLDCSYRFTEDGERQVDELLEQWASNAVSDPVDPTYLRVEGFINVVCGTPGTVLNPETAKQAMLDAMQQGLASIELPLESVPAAVLDAAALNEEFYTEASPIQLDENGEMTPAVVGVSIDVGAAQAALDAAGPGESVFIPLVYSQPDYALADAQGLLYKDILSECQTNVGGSANRVYNVSLAASHCNGIVLMPGDVFSYHAAVGNCTVAEGYAVDLGFAGGQTVDMVGGGICQVSSSLYYCTVYANLEIVERRNHAFTVDYLPAGLDATFYSSAPDYRFRNNTDYPVKITATVKDRTLTIRFFGTNPDGNYVTTERSEVATVPYTTVYSPDPEIPQGTTKVGTTPYTGKTIEVYRCVYSADGTLLSRTHENTSKYAKRDKVILYNPADAASLGIEVPPEETAPVETPPMEMPPAWTAPVETPPVITQPVETPPVITPPVETPPVETQPVETSPVETPPVETPPVESGPSLESFPGIVSSPDPEPTATLPVVTPKLEIY